jgi:hypothetical protein
MPPPATRLLACAQLEEESAVHLDGLVGARA